MKPQEVSSISLRQPEASQRWWLRQSISMHISKLNTFRHNINAYPFSDQCLIPKRFNWTFALLYQRKYIYIFILVLGPSYCTSSSSSSCPWTSRQIFIPCGWCSNHHLQAGSTSICIYLLVLQAPSHNTSNWSDSLVPRTDRNPNTSGSTTASNKLDSLHLADEQSCSTGITIYTTIIISYTTVSKACINLFWHDMKLHSKNANLFYWYIKNITCKVNNDKLSNTSNICILPHFMPSSSLSNTTEVPLVPVLPEHKAWAGNSVWYPLEWCHLWQSFGLKPCALHICLMNRDWVLSAPLCSHSVPGVGLTHNTFPSSLGE